MTIEKTGLGGFNYEKIGQEFRRERGDRSLAEISKQTGISASHIMHIEKGTHAPSVEIFVRLALHYNLAFSPLLDSAIPTNSNFWRAEAEAIRTQQEDADTALCELIKLLTDLLVLLRGCGQTAKDKTGQHVTREVLISAHGLLMDGLQKIDICGMTSAINREESAKFVVKLPPLATSTSQPLN